MKKMSICALKGDLAYLFYYRINFTTLQYQILSNHNSDDDDDCGDKQ